MSHVAIDELDRSILVALQADGRVTNLDLSRTVGLSAAATHARVRRLEASGVIRGYAALVDAEATGFDLVCLISISMQVHQAAHVERTREALRAMPEVLECHHLTGQYDYLLKVALRDRRALERFVVERLTPLPGVARIQTSIVLAEVKSTTALPL
jgi:Lrp/AsnC family leucine-responsive transcriptional regulator